VASLQFRNGVYRLLFQYNGRQATYTVGSVPLTEARQWKSRTENLLMRVEQRMLEVPRGVAIADFIRCDGKPPVDPAILIRKDTTLHQLTDGYITTVSNGAIEANTLATAKTHIKHLEKTLSRGFLLAGLTLGKLQDHITRRATKVSAVTIKKELDTFRSIWNWGLRMKWVDQPFPASGLVYPKTDEKLPFMTWNEIERRVNAGGNAEELWECLYLDTAQVAELLDFAKSSPAPDWVYPMMVMAAHTGARRSEMIRARVEDFDFAVGTITIREKKRARGTRTTRRVPISPLLASVLVPILDKQVGRLFAFGPGDRSLSVQSVHKALWRALKKGKWSVLRGWHTLRHSFISACASKGIDQRFLDEWVGHQTDQQRIRYRHLYPSAQEAAMKLVFN
jgi:integrase